MFARSGRIVRFAVSTLLCSALLAAVVPGTVFAIAEVAAATTLTGTVTDALTGLPIPGALVYIGDAEYDYRAYTDSQGRYSISGGRDPFYSTYVAVPLRTGKRTVFMVNSGHEMISKQVVLNAGRTTGADAQLGPERQEGSVSVYVRDSDFTSLDAWVSIYRATADGPEYVAGRWTTAAEEPREFTLPTGSYYVWAMGPGWDGRFSGGGSSLASASLVEVGPGGNSDVEIELMGWTADAPFDVLVKSASTGAPLPGINVSLTDIGPLGEEIGNARGAGTTNSTGHFIGLTGNALHRLKFEDPTDNYAAEYLDDALVRSDADPFAWEAFPFNAAGTLDLAATVVGSNRDDAGSMLLPVEGGERVTLYTLSSATGEWTELCSTGWNSDGTYRLPTVHPGRYRVGSTRLNGASGMLEQSFYRASGSATSIDDAEDVLLSAGDTRDGIDFAFGDPIPLPDLRVLRVEGTDRYRTALEVSKGNFSSAETVVLATGSNFPDALSASALAGAYEGPLLLTETTRLTSGVADEIIRLRAKHVVLVGSTAAISAAVASSVDAIEGVSVERVCGMTRYDTSAMVARKVARVLGVDSVPQVFLVRGDSFADALSASSLAYRNKMPVILTEANGLRVEADCALGYLGVQHVVIVGSTKAVSSGTATSVANNHKSISIERVSGADRYATSAALAEWGTTHGYCGSRIMGVATGRNYPDALGGGAAVGAHNGVLLLTDANSLSAPVKGFITGHSTIYTAVQLFGASGAVSDGVEAAVSAALTH